MPADAKLPTGRVPGIDGLRGVGAVVVALFHWTVVVRPTLVYGTPAGTSFDDRVARSPLVVLYNGSFAVFVFFVLSGLVLATATTRSTHPFPSLIWRRYLRLAVPMLAAVVVAWGLFQWQPNAGMTYLDRQSPLAGPEYRLLAKTQSVPRDFIDALVDPFWTAFVLGGSPFNTALWTMRIELVGSIAIYLLYRAVTPPWRWLPLLAAAVTLIRADHGWYQYGMAFIAGAALFELHSRGWLSNWRGPLRLFPWLFLLIGLYLGGFPAPGSAGSWLFPVDAAVRPYVGNNYLETIESTGALFLVAAVLTGRPLMTLLDRPLFRYLGRVSFALYLVHVPLLCTLFVWTADALTDRRVPLVTPIATIVFAIASFAVATILTTLVDRPLMQWLNGK